MRATWALVLVVAACDEPPIAADDLTLRVVAGAEEVDFGQAFPLTIVRSWRKGLVPQDWSEKALAPLRLRLAAASRRQTATHVEDTRRYDAFAFGCDTLAIAAPAFVARDASGSEHSVPGPVLRLRVRTALAGSAGPVELPGDLLPEPMRWRGPLLAASATLALGLSLWGLATWFRRRRPAPIATAPASSLDPTARALHRLAHLRAQHPVGEGPTEKYFIELAATLREYVASRFAVRCTEMTTEETLAAPAITALAEAVRAHAAATLFACDGVKFARALPDVRAREHTLQAAEHFVRACAPGGSE